MPRIPPWLTVLSILLLIGLLIDDMRLRSELDSQALTTTEGAKKAIKKSPSLGVSKSRAPHAQPPRSRPNPDFRASKAGDEAIEVRIEEEVAARLNVAVETRMGEDLDLLVEERVEARIEARHDERRERHQEAMREVVEEFVAEAGLGNEIETRMLTVMEDAMNSLGETFRAVHNGEMEREDVHPEMDGIREDMGEALVEILGPEEAERFQGGIDGPLGKH
jgi:hypothetical protein